MVRVRVRVSDVSDDDGDNSCDVNDYHYENDEDDNGDHDAEDDGVYVDGVDDDSGDE